MGATLWLWGWEAPIGEVCAPYLDNNLLNTCYVLRQFWRIKLLSCANFDVHCTIDNHHYMGTTMHFAHDTLHNVHCTLYSVQCTFIRSPYNVYNVYPLYYTYITHIYLPAIYISIIYIYIMHTILFTLQFKICTYLYSS